MLNRRGVLLSIAALLAACASDGAPVRGAGPALCPAGHVEIEPDRRVGGARFGGISGLDQDAATGLWALISDDRSAHGPARFHMARLSWARGRLAGVEILSAIALRDAAGRAFPPADARTDAAGEVVDPESIRFDPRGGGLVWSSEGDAEGGFAPSIRRMGPDGRATGAIPPPPWLAFDPEGRTGPRPNLTLEGLSWTLDGRALWAAMEGPLRQDGPPAADGRGARVRIVLLDRAGKMRSQRFYEVDPPSRTEPGRLADSGVSEVLAAGKGRLLVLERAGAQAADGRFAYRVRLYCARMDGGGAVAAKRLVLDFADAPVPVDNFEAMGWGPKAPDGRPSLVLASDNNFDPRRPTYLAAFTLAGSGGLAAWRRRHCP